MRLPPQPGARRPHIRLAPTPRKVDMTTTVIVLVNGSDYEATVTQKNSQGDVVATQAAKGGEYVQAHVWQGNTLEVTEKNTNTAQDRHPQ